MDPWSSFLPKWGSLHSGESSSHWQWGTPLQPPHPIHHHLTCLVSPKYAGSLRSAPRACSHHITGLLPPSTPSPQSLPRGCSPDFSFYSDSPPFPSVILNPPSPTQLPSSWLHLPESLPDSISLLSNAILCVLAFPATLHVAQGQGCLIFWCAL